MFLCDTCIHKKTCRFYKDLGDGIDNCNDYHSVKDYLYLPCKPGDIVYAVLKQRRDVKVCRCIVNNISLNYASLPASAVLDAILDEKNSGCITPEYVRVSLSRWGDTLFSSQIDAENAREVLLQNG